jgi:hypothetical protein
MRTAARRPVWKADGMPARPRALPIALALVALLVCAASASAQTYTVTRTDDPNPAPCEPTNCSLRNALTAANATTTVDDVVVLPASSAPYILQYEELALPIADEVEVRGAGADKTVVKGDGKESIFFVGTFKATLSGLTITGGTSAIQSNGDLLVRGVSIEGNKWNGGTAGIITNGPLTVESSFLGFNRTDNVTGGVIHSNAPVTIVNSTLAHNTSKGGPGAISTAADIPVTILNSAIVSNRSETDPAAAVGGSPLTVRNSVFADNRDTAGVFSCFSFMPIVSLGGNVSDDASCGAGASDKPNVDPGLGPLELHGGTTKVYSLLAGSPAIDFASDCPGTDQRGVARPQGAACDSGSYEAEVKPVTLPLPGKLLMRLGKGRLILTKKNRVRVRLTCPADVPAPPCQGAVELRLPMLRTLVGGIRDSRPTPRYPKAGFQIKAGKTKALGIKVSREIASYLRSGTKPRKVRVVVRARDAAGNASTLEARRRIVPAKRR